MLKNLKTHAVTNRWCSPTALVLIVAGLCGCASSLGKPAPTLSSGLVAITAQPTSATVVTGQSATFAVVASGTAPLNYQWSVNSGSGFAPISAATLPTYNTGPTTPDDNGMKFEVTVSDSVDSVTSAPAMLTVAGVAPTITTQPTSQTVLVGQSATFSVVANGTVPLNYQWLQNTGSGFSAISGATSPTYSTPATTSTNNGTTFEVTVSNTSGSVTSNPATLMVSAVAPTIATQPASQTVGSGQPATFTVVANGTAPLNYQWLQNTGSGFTNISGATSSSYGVTATSANNGTIFEVAVSNVAGSVTSVAATLSLSGTAPTITTQPSNQTVSVGQTATFTVVASGTPTLTYQWLQNTGTGFTNISGATSASYTTPPTTTGNSGNTFEVKVSNSQGSVTSNAATLTVTATAPTITTQPSNQTVNAGQTATFTVVANGTAPLTYQWMQNTGSGFTNIGGATSASYTTPVTSSANNGTTFEVKVSNSGGSVTSSAATLTVLFAPTITTQPSSQNVNVGQTATFTVVANGTAPLSYQWAQNTGSGFANINGATSASYTTPATTNANNGTTFEVTVTNGQGSVTSNPATLTVTSSGPSVPSYGSGLTSTGLTLNGDGAINGTALELTNGGASEASSGFFNTPVNVQSFTTTFTFQPTNANADGLTFTIQNNSPSALGGAGGSLGYGPTSGTTGGIANSVAVGFQLDISGGETNLLGMWMNGASPAATPGTDMSGSGINLHSGDTFKVRINYNGSIMSVDVRDVTQDDINFTESFPINIPATVGSSTAYVGFTGADGGLTSTQDILSWSFSNSPTGTSGTFTYPVDSPAFVGLNDYSTYNGQYHTGLDLCPGTNGCVVGNPIYAAASGTIQAVQVTTDASQTMCDGSSTGSLPTENNNHLGNAIVIAHSNGKFSVYGHLDCVWPGIAPGVAVSQGQRIGNMGHSQYGVRSNSFTPHVHFEIKDAGTVEDPTGQGYSGFTPDLPDGYGYHDPRLYFFPITSSSMTPTAVKIVGSPLLNVLTGPDTSYSLLNTVSTGQEFVAFASSGSWYEIYLPNSQGAVSGWIPASAGSQALASPDSTATKIQVGNTGGAGLLVNPGPSSSANFVSWVNNAGYVPFVQNCNPTAKIWDGQYYVTFANQSGWYEYYLPGNFYFSSGNACGAPSGPGPSSGWSSASLLSVVP